MFPTEPRPIPIERFIELRFGIEPTYEETAPALFGYSAVSVTGEMRIGLNRRLGESSDVVISRFERSTLAHEAGHLLLHGEFLRYWSRHLQEHKHVCRPIERTWQTRTLGDELERAEHQAWLATWYLLIPDELFDQGLGSFLEPSHAFFRGLQKRYVSKKLLRKAARRISNVFDVNMDVQTWVYRDPSTKRLPSGDRGEVSYMALV